jgi:hypothetical protein
MFEWIRNLFCPRRRPFRRPRSARPGPSFRPTLLVLEDRVVPATLTVTTTADSGAGSLRAQVAAASAGTTIVFAPGLSGTIALTSGPIGLTVQNVTINGGTAGISIDGDDNNQLFVIGGQNGNNGDTISNLIMGGGLAAGTNGGAIVVGSGSSLTLSGDSLMGNSAAALSGVGGDGGAIANYGNLTVNNCVFGTNQADRNVGSGGAIYNTGQLTISNSNFQSNTCGADGGGIDTNNNINLTSDTLMGNSGYLGGAIWAGASTPGTTTLTVTGCTLNGNTASTTKNGAGGAIWTSDVLNVQTSSFQGNNAGGWGGAIEYYPASSAPSTITLNEDTFTGNTANFGGGVNIDAYYDNPGAAGSVVVTVTNSTFYQNTASVSSTGWGGGLNVNLSLAGTATGSVTLVNDTFFKNLADAAGGAFAMNVSNSGTGTSSVALYSLTVYRNSSSTNGTAACIDAPARTVTLDNNIFDGNSGAAGYTGPLDIGFHNPNAIATEQYNLVGSSDQGQGFKGKGDIIDKANNPGLAASLAANGAKPGYPQTLALSPASAGYLTGDPGLFNLPNPYNLDARGLARQAKKVSMGAEDPNAQ